MPPPRADAPLDPVQVQQATDDLVTQRNQLNAEMQKNPQTAETVGQYDEPAAGKESGRCTGQRTECSGGRRTNRRH